MMSWIPVNDADEDGICGDVDTAHTMMKMMQMKMTFGDVECPYDFENDADQDDICGDVDECPYDA